MDKLSTLSPSSYLPSRPTDGKASFTTKYTMVDVNRNEATRREFISSLIVTTVAHVKAEEWRLQLKIEQWLDGPRGYVHLTTVSMSTVQVY